VAKRFGFLALAAAAAIGCGGGGGGGSAPSGNAKWTVLVYLNAANDLSDFDELNVNQMESVAGNPDVRFVLQWKQARGFWDPDPTFEGTRRVLVKSDSSDAIVSETVQDMGAGVDMGDWRSLRDFVAWGKATYPAERYVLIVWNHGNGWRRDAQSKPLISRGVSYDDQTGNSIDTWELHDAIGSNVDILSWDSSLMQMMEVAYEVRERATYVVGSQESPPGEGLPYQRVFRRFRDNPDGATVTLARAFVDGMMEEPAYNSRKITQSVLESAKLPALATAIDRLADSLRTENATAIQNARNQSQTYSPDGDRYFFDLYDLTLKLDASGVGAGTLSRTEAVRDAIDAAVVYERHNANSPGSRGVSIDFSPGSYYMSSSKRFDYPRIRLGVDTSWDEFLSAAP